MHSEVEINVPRSAFLPVYQHLLEDTGIDIDFIYGSRDSGKSRDEAQRLVLKCLSSDYFRWILGRKQFNTIKDSQWQTIKDVVTEWNLEQFFQFRVSPLEIHCVNGNKFIARGFDDPAQIKSIQNPSGAWIEEGDQLTEDDWITLITSIRTNTGKTKIDVTFNPLSPGDYRQFWLYRDYFSHTDQKSFTHTKFVNIAGKDYPIHYRATHSTYHDNRYCSAQRMAVYENLRNTSPYHYKVYALGEWGNRENKSPFVLTFDRNKHLGHTEFDPSMELFLSFDFNRNPMCCNVIQWDHNNKVNWIDIIKIPNSSTGEVCDVILMKYPDALYVVNGDYSGTAGSAMVQNQDLNNHYKIIRHKLRLRDGQIQIRPNPKLTKNRVLVNMFFAQVDVTINPDTCQALIFDIENAEMLADGSLLKTDRKDEAQQLDVFDGARYFINMNFQHLDEGHILDDIE